jgi:hypothetical protein
VLQSVQNSLATLFLRAGPAMPISRVRVTVEPLPLHNLLDQDEWFMGRKIFRKRLARHRWHFVMGHNQPKATPVGSPNCTTGETLPVAHSYHSISVEPGPPPLPDRHPRRFLGTRPARQIIGPTHRLSAAGTPGRRVYGQFGQKVTVPDKPFKRSGL